MKFVAFNKAALLKALRLAVLFLLYAASQASLQAGYNPSTGTPGNDNVSATGNFTGSFYGNGGSDNVLIISSSQSNAAGGNNITLEDGTVTNNGSLSNTYDGTASNLYFSGTSIQVFNNGILQVNATSATNAYANGILIDGDGDTGSILIRNTGRISASSGATSSNSWAYGVNVDFDTAYGQTLRIENSGSILANSSDSDYSYASSVYVDAYSQYGNSSVVIDNTGTLRATSAYSGDDNSEASALYIEGGSYYGNSSIVVTNSGLVQSQSGYSGSDNSNAYGLELSSTSDYGQASITVTNAAAGRILVESDEASNDSDATGISAYAAGYNGAAITITNQGQILVSSSYANDESSATGIDAEADAYFGDANISITNSGLVSASSAYGDEDSTARGIRATAGSYYGNALVSVTNTGTIRATTGDAEEETDAIGILTSAYTTYGSATTVVTNSGTIEARAGASFDDDESLAAGIRSTVSGYDSSLLLEISNTGSISAISDFSDEEDSIARGISASMYGDSSGSTPTIRITNTGSLFAQSGYAEEEDSRATGIQANNSADNGLIEIFNQGTIQAISGEADDDDSIATGISASAYSSYGTIRITNSGSISAHAGDADDGSEAFGIRAEGYTVEVSNSGTITTSSEDNDETLGIRASGTYVTVTNAGGSIQSPYGPSISVNAYSTGTVNLNGISLLEGVVEGVGGNDTLNLNLLGVTPEQAAALQLVLDAIGGGFGTFTAAGQTYEIDGFETINLNAQTFAQAFGGVEGFDSLLSSLDSINGPIAPELASLFTALAGLGEGGAVPPEEVQKALSLLTGQDVVTALGNLGINQAGALSRTLTDRALSLRGGSSGLDFSGLRLRDPSLIAEAGFISSRLDNLLAANSSSRALSDVPASPGIATAPEPKRINAWVRGEATTAEQEDKDGVSGYDDVTGGATVGADYRLSRSLAVGILGGANTTKADLNAGGRIEGVSALFGTYATWAQDGWHAQGLAAYVRGETDIRRTVFGGTNTADTSSNAGVFSAAGGYDFKAGGWKFGPTLGLQYAHILIDGYTESGPTALRVDENSVDSLQSILGFHASREFDFTFVRLTPQFLASWNHEFLNDSNSTRTSFLNSPGISSFEVDSRDPERDFALLGLGCSAVLPDMEMITLFLGYNAQVGQESYTAHSLNAGLKVEF